LVQTTVVKVVENGVICKFMKSFIGYIFHDHTLSTMKKGSKFLSRIIALDFSEKKIFLSPHEPIVNLKSFQNKDYLGRIIQGTLTI